MFHRESGTPKGFRAERVPNTNVTEVYLYDYIGGWDGITSLDMVQTFAAIDGEVDLHINSGGGDIFEGTAIFNVIKNYDRGKVTSIVDGVAASAASFIALAADEVVIEDNGTMMVHDGWGLTIGDEQDHLDAAGVLGKLSNTIAKMYADKTGGSQEEWREVMRGEAWYDADEAVAAKLADRKKSGKTTDASNAFDLSIFNYAGRAEAPKPARTNNRTPSTSTGEGWNNALKGLLV
jgi:ATP-dependent protease ClpP protease subunit